MPPTEMNTMTITVGWLSGVGGGGGRTWGGGGVTGWNGGGGRNLEGLGGLAAEGGGGRKGWDGGGGKCGKSKSLVWGEAILVSVNRYFGVCWWWMGSALGPYL